MSDYITQAAAIEAPANLATCEFLADFNRQGKALWTQQTLPTRKTENWKYTHLKSLHDGAYLTFADTANAQAHRSATAELVALYDIEGFQAGNRLVFVDGHYCSSLSSFADDAALQLTLFSQADEHQQQFITQHLNSAIATNNHMFAALNAAHTHEGVLLVVAKNQKLQQPVQIISVTTAHAQPFMVNQRALVVLEAGSEACVLEHFVSTDDGQNCFTNSVTELLIGENATLTHYRLQREQEDALHIGGVHCNLARSANLNSFQLGLGGKIKRVDIVVNHLGEGAHSELNGVYLPRNKQHIDYHTCIEHTVPHCSSNECFRGIIADSARAVFNGRIHIHPQAQKTLAQLSNKNLLTSNKAEVDTKPELEIYADDVQCAHGATVAQLDTESLHYFKTRGIHQDEAMVMLSFGFINELLNQLVDDAVGDYLRPQLANLFAPRAELTRHLL